jgi:hypothetical protein
MPQSVAMGCPEATALVVSRMRARPSFVGAAVFGTALTVPVVASTAWAAPAAPATDVSGMSPDAAEHWLQSSQATATPPPAHQPAPPQTPPTTVATPVEEAEPPPTVAPEQGPPTGTTSTTTTTTTTAPPAAEPEPAAEAPAAPAPAPEPGPPTGTTTTTTPSEPEVPPDRDPAPDVRGMSPDAAERWLEQAEERQPAAEAPETSEDPEREQRFDPAPGCILVQGPYPDEADRPCAFPDGTRIPTGSIGTPPQEARPCVPLEGPYLTEESRPCEFPDGRQIPSNQVGQPPTPPAQDCRPVEGVDEGEPGLCAYPDGRTSSTEDEQREPAPAVNDFSDLAEGGRGEELVGELLEPSDEEFGALVEEGTIDGDFTNRSYFPVEPAPGDGIVVLDFFIPQDRSVFLRGDDRELQDPVQSDLELTDSRVTVVLDRDSGRGMVTQSGTCTVGIEVCQDPRPIELGPEDTREQGPVDANEFDVRTDEETISLTYDVLNSITPDAYSVDGTVRLRRRPDGLYQVVYDTRDDYPAISIWQYRPGDTPRLIDYDRGKHVLEGAVPDCDLPDLPDGPDLPSIDLPGSWFDWDMPDLPDGPDLPNIGPIYGVCR